MFDFGINVKGGYFAIVATAIFNAAINFAFWGGLMWLLFFLLDRYGVI